MFRRALLFLFGILVFASCDNTLDVTADFERVPVVYGVINPKSDTQYVRIGRSYLGENGPAGGFDHPDSLYYPSLVAELKALVAVSRGGAHTVDIGAGPCGGINGTSEHRRR